MVDTTPIVEQPTQPTAENGKGGEKLFSQEDVNRIVKERLERDRAKRGNASAPAEPTEAEKKEAELNARETRLDCRAYLLERGYSPELLDILGTSNFEHFMKAADDVYRLVHESARQIAGPAPLYDNTPPTVEMPVTGFEHGRKHTPRQIHRYSNE